MFKVSVRDSSALKKYEVPINPPNAQFENPKPKQQKVAEATTKIKVDLLITDLVVLVDTEPDSKKMNPT